MVDGKSSYADVELLHLLLSSSGICMIVNKQACGTNSCKTLYNLSASIFGTSLAAWLAFLLDTTSSSSDNLVRLYLGFTNSTSTISAGVT